ncbi:MAG: hypothetical protein ABIA21_03245 [Candidatus Aenigmatarchaeota archaeon]
MRKKRVRAIALLSGGLDSRLAVKIMQKQGIELIALNTISIFCTCGSKGCTAAKFAKEIGISIIIVEKKDDYFKIIQKPKHGYGKNMNPCIDCRIYLFKLAKKMMKKLGAKFIVTGEVLDQRPMSQHKNAMFLIDRKAGVDGLVLRPLSAKLLPETIPEKMRWVDRKKLLGIRGRRREQQISLAHKMKIDFPCPSGGCLLTYEEFAKKVRDFLKHNKKFTKDDAVLLKIGRHFRFGKNKIIVGRNHAENLKIMRLKKSGDMLFEAKNIMGPTSLLQGPKTAKSIKFVAALTARYSDSMLKMTPVVYGSGFKRVIKIQKANEKEIKKYMITK